MTISLGFSHPKISTRQKEALRIDRVEKFQLLSDSAADALQLSSDKIKGVSSRKTKATFSNFFASPKIDDMNPLWLLEYNDLPEHIVKLVAALRKSSGRDLASQIEKEGLDKDFIEWFNTTGLSPEPIARTEKARKLAREVLLSTESADSFNAKKLDFISCKLTERNREVRQKEIDLIFRNYISTMAITPGKAEIDYNSPKNDFAKFITKPALQKERVLQLRLHPFFLVQEHDLLSADKELREGFLALKEGLGRNEKPAITADLCSSFIRWFNTSGLSDQEQSLNMKTQKYAKLILVMLASKGNPELVKEGVIAHEIGHYYIVNALFNKNAAHTVDPLRAKETLSAMGMEKSIEKATPKRTWSEWAKRKPIPRAGKLCVKDNERAADIISGLVVADTKPMAIYFDNLHVYAKTSKVGDNHHPPFNERARDFYSL